MRKNFADILNEAGVDAAREYGTLHDLFYESCPIDGLTAFALCEVADSHFQAVPFRGTSTNREDFEERHGLCFQRYPYDFDIDMLVTLCEYVFNLLVPMIPECSRTDELRIRFAIDHIERVINLIGYTRAEQNGLVVFVEKNPAAIAAAKATPAPASTSVMIYLHHSMKGDLQEKRAILTQLANHLEPKRDQLKAINRKLETNLFFLFNNLHIRHNNIDPELSKHYKEAVAAMSSNELESWYDETYQMILLAILELDCEKTHKSIESLKDVLIHGKRPAPNTD